jgi:hypothetical protein
MSGVSEAVSIDRHAIRAMVEDFWRSFLAVGRTNPAIGQQTVMRYEERITSTAALMPDDQARVFLKAVDEERETLFNEYNRDPDALKHRLGLPLDPAPVVFYQQRQGFGEMAVRTAVRATIWETIFSLFRFFR